MTHEVRALEERRYCLGVRPREGDVMRTSFTYVEAYPTPFSILLAKAIGKTRANPALARMVPRVLEGCIHAAWEDLYYHQGEDTQRDVQSLFFRDDKGTRISALVTAGANLTGDDIALIKKTRAAREHLARTLSSARLDGTHDAAH